MGAQEEAEEEEERTVIPLLEQTAAFSLFKRLLGGTRSHGAPSVVSAATASAAADKETVDATVTFAKALATALLSEAATNAERTPADVAAASNRAALTMAYLLAALQRYSDHGLAGLADKVKASVSSKVAELRKGEAASWAGSKVLLEVLGVSGGASSSSSKASTAKATPRATRTRGAKTPQAGGRRKRRGSSAGSEGEATKLTTAVAPRTAPAKRVRRRRPATPGSTPPARRTRARLRAKGAAQ